MSADECYYPRCESEMSFFVYQAIRSTIIITWDHITYYAHFVTAVNRVYNFNI